MLLRVPGRPNHLLRYQLTLLPRSMMVEKEQWLQDPGPSHQLCQILQNSSGHRNWPNAYCKVIYKVWYWLVDESLTSLKSLTSTLGLWFRWLHQHVHQGHGYGATVLISTSSLYQSDGTTLVVTVIVQERVFLFGEVMGSLQCLLNLQCGAASCRCWSGLAIIITTTATFPIWTKTPQSLRHGSQINPMCSNLSSNILYNRKSHYRFFFFLSSYRCE